MCDYDDCDGASECSNNYIPEPLVIYRDEKQRMSASDTFVITNELAYRIKCIGETETLEKRRELIQDMLLYLREKRAFLRENRGFLRVMMAKCKEWVEDPDAAPMKDTLVQTIEAFNKM